jgi:hypothetical protein
MRRRLSLQAGRHLQIPSCLPRRGRCVWYGYTPFIYEAPAANNHDRPSARCASTRQRAVPTPMTLMGHWRDARQRKQAAATSYSTGEHACELSRRVAQCTVGSLRPWRPQPSTMAGQQREARNSKRKKHIVRIRNGPAGRGTGAKRKSNACLWAPSRDDPGRPTRDALLKLGPLTFFRLGRKAQRNGNEMQTQWP